MTMTTMSQSEYADYRGVTRQYINKLVRQGRLVMTEDDKIVVAEADANLRDVETEEPATFNDAVARRQIAEAALAEFKLNRLNGALIEKAEAVSTTLEIFGDLREKLLEIPVNVAGKSLAQKTEREVAQVIRDEIERVLTAFAGELPRRLDAHELAEHPPVSGERSGGGDAGGEPGVDAAAEENSQPVG